MSSSTRKMMLHSDVVGELEELAVHSVDKKASRFWSGAELGLWGCSA